MRSLIILGVLPVLLPAASLVDSLSSTPCPTATLTTYDTFLQANPCSNGILNFSDFTFTATGSAGTPLLTANEIELTPEGPSAGPYGATGFEISAAPGYSFSVGPGQSAQYIIDWFFEIDSGPSASGASLHLDPGNVSITQDYCVDSLLQINAAGNPFCSNGSNPAPSVQSLFVDFADPDDSIIFNPPAEEVASVMTVIDLVGGAETGSSFDSTTGTSQIVPPAALPEPGTILLASAGLLTLSLYHRRRLRR